MLSGMGHKVSCWATAAPSKEGCSSWPYEVHVFDAGWPLGWRRSRGFVRGLSREVDSVDILHINEFWLFPVLAASRIACAHRVPYVLRPAGSLDPWSLQYGWWKRVKKLAYLEMIGKRTMRQAACLHATSDREAEGLRRLGHRDRTSIIPNGVDLDVFGPGDPSEAEVYWPWLKGRPIVLFLSRLDPKKGLDLLIPAWA
ncbi:MAG: glycosyltransferase, partial [Solirubrobacterales bacterium]